jgi:nucleotide-binding universal stress UspA family protein
MISHIVVPLDRSPLAQQVLPYVSFLALALGARIDLLQVIEPLPTAGLMDPSQKVYQQWVLTRLNQDAITESGQ